MEKASSRHILHLLCAVLVLGIAFVVPGSVHAQYYTPQLGSPAPWVFPPAPVPGDSVPLPLPIPTTVPRSYEDLMHNELAYDLATPSNITTVADYDPASGCYVVRTKVGDTEIGTPFMLTAEQYNNWMFRRSMQQYYRDRNMELITDKEKQPFNIFDMNFALGPLEKIFVPGGVSLRTHGSVLVRSEERRVG